MKLKDPRITLLVNREHTTITIHDNNSAVDFIEIKLTPEQLSSALSRMAYTPCEVEVRSLDVLGKKRIGKDLIFEIPVNYRERENKMLLDNLTKLNTPEGWEASTYFGSQNSFFSQDDKYYARTTMFQWIDQDEN